MQMEASRGGGTVVNCEVFDIIQRRGYGGKLHANGSFQRRGYGGKLRGF